MTNTQTIYVEPLDEGVFGRQRPPDEHG